MFEHDDYGAVRIYRSVAGCATLVATVEIAGPIAFVEMYDTPSHSMPELSVDTWLMHGDRLRHRFVWSGDQYVPAGEEEIPGPHRPRRP